MTNILPEVPKLQLQEIHHVTRTRMASQKIHVSPLLCKNLTSMKIQCFEVLVSEKGALGENGGKVW